MVDLTKFIEVSLNEQDDFLKVRETLTRIGVSSRKEKVLYQSSISYTSKVDITLFILKNYLRLMENLPIYPKTIFKDEMQLQTFWKNGVSLRF